MMEDQHVLYLNIVHKTEINSLLVDEDSNEWSQGNMKFQSLMHFDKICIKDYKHICKNNNKKKSCKGLSVVASICQEFPECARSYQEVPGVVRSWSVLKTSTVVQDKRFKRIQKIIFLNFP